MSRQSEAVRGMTIAELTVSIGLFALLSVAILALFSLGVRAATRIDTRMSTSSQLSSLRATLARDLQFAHYSSIKTAPRTVSVDGTSQRKDSFSVAVLNDWNDADSFDRFGLAQWDGWAVYRATQTQESELMYHRLASGSARGPQLYREPPHFRSMADSPLALEPGWSDLTSTRRLAEGVRNFRIRLQPEFRSVDLSVTLVGRPSSRDAKEEVVHAQLTFTPKNTVPTD